MGWMDEYNKALQKKRKDNVEQTAVNTASAQNSSSWLNDYHTELNRLTSEEFAPISTVGTLSQDKGNRKWYETGHFEDGYDFGDISKTILGISDKKKLKTFEAPDTTDTLKELKQKRDSAEQTADALKYTQQYNQMALYQYADTLSKTKMDGQKHTVLEEIEILANMKDGKEKDKRKQAVLDKMESLGMDSSFYAHFAGDGEFDMKTFGKWAYNASMAGLNTFNKGLLDTADVLLGAPLKALGWENNPISEGAEYYNDLYSSYRYNANLLAEKLGGNAWNFGTDAVEGTLGALPNALLMFMTGGQSATASTTSLMNQAAMQTGNFLTKAGLTAETMMKNPQYWMSFARTLGSDYKEAKEMGASDLAATVGSVLKSTINSGIEIGLDGGSGIQGLPDGLKDGGKPFWEWVESSLEEGGEEILQKFVGEVVNKVGYGSDEEILNPIEYAKEGTLGMLSGMALGGGQTAVQSGVNAFKEHQANKLTDMEQSVMDKIVEKRIAQKEKDGKTLTAKEKADIEKEVERNLRKGYLKAEEIEEAIGGEVYESYKAEQDKFFASDAFQKYDKTKRDSQKRIEKLEKQLEEIGNQPNTVANSKKYDAIQNRIDILKKRTQSMHDSLLPEANRIIGIKEQMRSSMMGTVKDSRLAETYNELARKKQKFQVDVNQYKNENAKKTVQSILDSGLGDNSNQFHETVEWLAKLSEDRNVTFDLTKTERLKGTEHYREGYVTNGFKTKNGDLTNITINLDGNVLNTTVGHEITHVLEEAGIYEDLSKAVREFAISKEGQEAYNARLSAIKEIYGDDQATIDSELTADIIGEYLFADYDFVHSLSTQNRNVFQKIYDEIKHMVKIATAGSKEARDLERVKKMFDKAWRENVKGKPDTKTEMDTEVDDVQHSIVKDQKTIDWLENQEYMTVYKAMSLHDGKLYPPMSSQEYVDEVYTTKSGETKTRRVRKLKNPSELGKWQQADERPDLIKNFKAPSKKYPDGYGTFDLLKSNGKVTGDVAYNPYEHTSNIVLNDQFAEAYQRPELVTVEYHIPKSELTSGYKAQYAKDPVGLTDWKTGIVATKLTKNKREVYLTRWSKPVRIVPDSEVAMKYKELLDQEEGISVPWNVVTPSLRTELEKLGVPIDYSDIKAGSTIKNFQTEMAKADELAQKMLDTKSIQYSYSAIPTHKKSLEKNFDFDNASLDLETINQRYDKIIGIWEKLGGELDSKFLNDWNNKVERPFTIFKAQSGYKYNVELSSMCKKGVPLFEAIDTIVKKEVMKELDMKVMGKEEKEILYDILKQKHFEIPCAICYVEQARQREGVVIDAFLNGKSATDKKGADMKLGWNQVLDSIQKEMKANGADYTFNFVSRDIATDKYIPAESDMDEQTYTAFAEAVKKIANEEITRYNKSNGKNRPLLKDVTPEEVKECFKGGLPSNLKIFKVLLTEPSSRFKIQNDLLYSSMTTKNLTMAHNGLYSLFNSQGGVSGYKTKQAPTVYWGEILNKKWKPEDTRKEGGIRNQSNSDFQMYTLLDQAQMYMDFSAKGYYLQAYTKVLSELKLFGLSRGKINASLIPQVKVYRNADGTVDVEKTMENAGLDENGNPIYDDIEGINHTEAFMLLEDPEYSKNIGGICIGYSDNHIRKLLDDARVQLIIGFHDKTNDPNKRYRGARYAKNYNGLNEATKTKADGTSETVHIGFNPFVKKAEQKFQYNKDTETFEGAVTYKGKTYTADDIPRLATDLYLEHCAKKNLTPAYNEFSGHQNYYKLLADFSLYDSEGHYAPHQKVAYNMPDSVPYLDADGNKQYMSSEDYIKIELQKELAVRDSLIDALSDDSEDGIIPRFKAEVEKRNIAPTQYSMTKQTDKERMDALTDEYVRLMESADQYWFGLFGEWLNPATEDITTSYIREVVNQSGEDRTRTGRKLLEIADAIDRIDKETASLRGSDSENVIAPMMEEQSKPEAIEHKAEENVTDTEETATDIESVYKDFLSGLGASAEDVENASFQKYVDTSFEGFVPGDVALFTYVDDEIDARTEKYEAEGMDSAEAYNRATEELSPVYNLASQLAEWYRTHRNGSNSTQYSMTKAGKNKMDEDYFAAIESGDEEVQKHLVREFAKASMPDSKLVDENGNLRVVYHGTNTGDFTVFNPDYIGMSSGDDGFFGMGFYFAYSKGEASYYGARRIIPAYLNLTNPFNFQRELHTYNGKRARYGHAPDAVALMNFADKFPDIAMHITMGAIKNGESSGNRISVFEFAKEFKDVIENKEFDYQEMLNDWGEKETLVTADPQVHEYEYNGETHSWRDFGFQKRFSYGADILDIAYEYLSNAVYSYIDIPRFTSVILDNNREFTAELKNRGYDGTIQSEHGDEAVAFYPNQIKSAEPITRDADGNVIPLSERFNPENDDLRYSISKGNKNDSGDWHIDGQDFGHTDEFEDFAPIRDDINTANTDSNAETVLPNTGPVLEEEKPKTHLGKDKPKKEKPTDGTVEKVKTKLQQKIANTQAELDKNIQLMEDHLAYYDGEIAKKQAEYDSKKDKNSNTAQGILRSIERLKRLKANSEADYSKRISDLEKRVEKMHSEDYQRAEVRRAKQEERKQFWSDLIGDTSSWKDFKLGVTYKTKTLRRILRSVVRDGRGNPDIQLADAIYDELETKYDHNEAKLKVESGKLKGIFKELNLNHSEDEYAQMLGEFRHNPETTLSEDRVKDFLEKHKDKIDEEKVNQAISEARKLYDDLIVRVNEVLKENGIKEIPYRKGYFPHFTNPKQNWLQKAFNWKPIDTEIPTSIAGLTQDFKPNKSWQSFAQKRKGDKTDYSLYQGLDTYIHGALDWIYHIDDIQNRRALENYIREIHSDEGIEQRIQAIRADDSLDADEVYDAINAILDEGQNPLSGLVRELMNRTNTLANKKSSLDREMEDFINRKVYSTLTNLNNRITANQVVGSLSSALTNFIPMVQSWHQVSPVYTVKGMGDYIRSVIKDDGVVEKSTFLTNRLIEEEKLYQTGWDKVSDKAGFMMNVVDGITSNTVWRSKYLQNLSEGMSETQAIKDADQFAKNLMGGRSRGNAPTIFDAKNPLVKMFTAFQLEVANQYGYMFDDVIKDSKSKTRLVKGYATAFLGAYAYNALYSSLVGRDAAFDPISIIEELLSGLFDDEEEKKDVLMDFGTNILEEVPFVGGMLGGGRVPISSAFPYSGYSNPVESALTDISEGKFSKEWLKPLWYLAMPVGGGQVKKTIEGLSMFSDDHPVTGSYTDSGNLRFPVEDTFGNRVQAAMFGQYANKNARDYFDNNRKALYPDQIQEYKDLDIPIRDYWDYREGLAEFDKWYDKADYIANLDLPVDKRNILINNISTREDPIDLRGYEEYDNYEEFDWAIKNPEKYETLSELGVSYSDYKNADEEKKKDYNWAVDYPKYVTLSKAVTNDVWEYREWYKDMVAFKADKDKNGKSISGTKKRKVIDYINSLDIDYGAKLVLMKSQYETIDDYNEEIFEYIRDKRDLTFEEKLSILKTLGYGVSDDGNVTWD